MRRIEDLIAENRVLAGMQPRHLELIAGCGRNVHFASDEMILREGEPADRFFVLRTGAVALEIAVPGRHELVIETLGPGDVLGWSWLFEPRRWQYDARATEPVAAVALDGVCLRGKCAADAELGYDLMQRFAGVLLRRLQATRLQLVDVYGIAQPR
jgi:CRP/FNR family transcriptional regulator, cyclic AMP receptor protein